MSNVEGELGEWLEVHRDGLAAAVTAVHYARVPELAARYGAAGRKKCEEDARHLLDYLRASATRSSPRLFVDYVGWAKVLLAGLGMPSSDLRTSLDCLRELVEREPPERLRAALLAPLQAAIDALEGLPLESPSLIDPAAAHAGLARRYLDLLLQGRRHDAMKTITDAAKEGTPVRAIYLNVFSPVQHEIGRLWQRNEITVAQEHYCTAVTQLVIAQLYPYIFATERKSRTLVATCVAGDLHEMGVRMLADFFEMDGWDTYYLGANVPALSVVATARERKADVVAISATISRHVESVAQLIAEIRRSDPSHRTRVMVGGYPFNIDGDLWRQVGADGHAGTAERAVELGNALVEGRAA